MTEFNEEENGFTSPSLLAEWVRESFESEKKIVLSASFDMINGATEEPPQQDAAIIFLTGSIKKVNVSREVLRTLKDRFPKVPRQ